MSRGESWLEVRLLASPEHEDELAGWLWAVGSRGQELRSLPLPPPPRVEVVAFFDPPFTARDFAPRFADSGWPEQGVRLLGAEVRGEEDWQRGFREAARPFAVGERLWIDPREPGSVTVEVPVGRLALQIPARTAFGTGTHESTRLALELLEDQDVEGREVLDVGTGTGVLSFAARAFGARRVVGFDIDAASPPIARDNQRRNGLREIAWFSGPIEALRRRPGFDLALLNVVPAEARPLLTALVSLLRADARLIASGVLASEASGWLDDLARAGFEAIEERGAGEWVALSLRFAGARAVVSR